MRFVCTLSLVTIVAGCGDGETPDPTKPRVEWTYRISSSVGTARPNRYTRPSIAKDGTIYVGGAIEDGSASCLFVLAPDGSLRERMIGSARTLFGPPSVWPAALPDDTGAYAVDRDGGLYVLKLDSEDQLRQMPSETFDHVHGHDSRFIGPLILGEKGEVFIGGTGAIYVLFIESRTTPLSYRVRGDGHPHAVVGPSGRITGRGHLYFPEFEAHSRGFGRGIQPLEDGSGRAFGDYGGFYDASRDLQGGPSGDRWFLNLGEVATSEPRVGHGETVYVTTSKILHAVDRYGKKLWELRTESDFRTEPLVTEDALYIADAATTLFALTPRGEEKWRLSLGPACLTPSFSPEGKLYVVCDDGILYAVRPPSL